MPLDKFVLILVVVFVAAGATVWLGFYVGAAAQMPVLGFGIIPIVLFAAVIWRVVAQRLNNPEDDHYDKIEK